MEALLLELLRRLERLGQHHGELYDSEAREQIGGIIMNGFVRRTPGEAKRVRTISKIILTILTHFLPPEIICSVMLVSAAKILQFKSFRVLNPHVLARG
jgi:hypothetical protein